MEIRLVTPLAWPPAALVAERDALVALAYELLDAHDDTARLARDLATSNLAWDSHLAYLRDLQRVGRELLAGAAR